MRMQPSGKPREAMRSAASMAAVLTIAVGLTLAACGSSSGDDEPGGNAAKVERIAGSSLRKVTLTKDAARRIDLRTAAVTDGQDATRLQIPYGAVLYDPDGRTWAFVRMSGLSFARSSITIERIVGDSAVLTAGPPAGTDVVTVGATELYGAEIGVGDE